MTWTLPKTWLNDEPLTANDMNVYISQNLEYLHVQMGTHIILRHQEPESTDGGTFTSGDWRTRPLNTMEPAVSSDVTLQDDQFTLAAGTYYIRASAPAFRCDEHRVRLQNVSDAVTLAEGTTEFTNASTTVMTRSHVQALVTIGTPRTLELQHRCASTQSSNGMGRSAGFGPEVYAVVEIWKIY